MKQGGAVFMTKACCSQMVTRLLVVGAIFLLSPVFSYAARPQTTNLVQNLLLKQSQNQTTVVVQGTRTPVFSSFRLHNPHRLVIDLSNADLRSLASSMHYRVGLVRHIGVQQFSSSTTRMGRLVLHLKGASQWTLKRKGTQLVVTLSGNTTTAKATSGTNAVSAKVRPVLRARSRGPVVRRSGVLSGPQGRRGSRLRRVFASNGRLFFRLSGVVGQYEVLQLRNPSRLVVDLYRVRKAFRGNVQVSCDTHGLSSVRFGRHKRKLRIVLDSCSKRPFQSFKAVAARRGLRVQFALKAKTSTGQILQPLAAATKSRVEVKHIGLSETTSASVLMIRTNSRNPVARVIQTAGGYTLRLQGAVLPSRLSQKMDTSDFRGVIREIKPVQRGSFVEIRVKSSQTVPTQLRRKGEVLLWSFLMPRKKLIVANKKYKNLLSKDAPLNSVERLHLVRQELDDEIEIALGKGRKTKAVDLQITRSKIDDALKGASPEFKQADVLERGMQEQAEGMAFEGITKITGKKDDNLASLSNQLFNQSLDTRQFKEITSKLTQKTRKDLMNVYLDDLTRKYTADTSMRRLFKDTQEQNKFMMLLKGDPNAKKKMQSLKDMDKIVKAIQSSREVMAGSATLNKQVATKVQDMHSLPGKLIKGVVNGSAREIKDAIVGATVGSAPIVNELMLNMDAKMQKSFYDFIINPKNVSKFVKVLNRLDDVKDFKTRAQLKEYLKKSGLEFIPGANRLINTERFMNAVAPKIGVQAGKEIGRK